MKKTGCKAAILILLAVLVLSTQAFAVRGGSEMVSTTGYL